MTLEHVERERNYCSVAHELKVPFTAVDANCSKCSRARESRLVRLSKECKHEQHGRRVVAISSIHDINCMVHGIDRSSRWQTRSMHDRARGTAKVFDLAFAYPVLPFAQIPGAAEGLNRHQFLDTIAVHHG